MRFAWALGLAVAGFNLCSAASEFDVRFDSGNLVSLKYASDQFPTEYIAPRARLGPLHVVYRSATEPWQTAETATTTREAGLTGATYSVPGRLVITSQFEVRSLSLVWRFSVKNISSRSIEIGDLATPLPMNGRFVRGTGATMSVLKHTFISGDGSFIFWMRPNSVGPYLLMTPLDGTTPEYWDAFTGRYQVYVHSRAAGDLAASKGTKWRIPETSLILDPGKTASYGYRFQWAKDYDDVRNILAANGSLDVQVVPGMTVPNDLDAEIALRSRRPVQGVDAEFPAQTQCVRLRHEGQTTIYRVHFSRLGENRLAVRYGKDRKTYLEFFSTEPIETLIKKRAAFLAKSSYHDPSKWYNGLISDWNMDTQVLLGPDNYDRITGWRIYEVSCDDPGLAKPAFLAAKNAEFPDQHEVEVLDEYIEHFVWGGLQQTTSEPYPYGIYGIPDWKTLRESKKKPHDGIEQIWRCYDYPHVILLYDSMYRLAAGHPEIHTRLKRTEYLERAFGTAKAMFTVPAKVDGWSAYGTGFYNERAILNVIADLESNGMVQEAATLRKFWGDKTKTFVMGKTDLFGSEYAFDSTGFESTQVLARYALDHGPELGIPADAARRFMDEQMKANIFCRGSIEPAYYYLGSDYRGGAGNAYTLSYMSQMGGCSVLDYGLHDAVSPSSYLRLGFASILSSWALMNTGTAESNYGYWYPGKADDGGAGGGFEPAPYGTTWLGQPHHRSSWYYACEIDLGFCGALRGAATVVEDDPIFGRICLGGSGKSEGNLYRLIPKDGLRKRLFLRTREVSADVVLSGARFAKGKEVQVDMKSFSLRLPTIADSPGPKSDASGFIRPKVSISMLPEGRYEVNLDGKTIATVSGGDKAVCIDLPLGVTPRMLTISRIHR